MTAPTVEEPANIKLHSISCLEVSPRMTLEEGLRKMDLKGVNYLAVKERGNIVGVVGKRDIELMGPFSASLHDIMDQHPFVVPCSSPLLSVITIMAEKGYSCSLVTDESSSDCLIGHVVGVFTLTDGLRVLSKILLENEEQHERMSLLTIGEVMGQGGTGLLAG